MLILIRVGHIITLLVLAAVLTAAYMFSKKKPFLSTCVALSAIFLLLTLSFAVDDYPLAVTGARLFKTGISAGTFLLMDDDWGWGRYQVFGFVWGAIFTLLPLIPCLIIVRNEKRKKVADL